MKTDHLKPPFEFEVYCNGRAIGAGVRITKQDNFEKAARKAALMVAKRPHPKGTIFVLVLRPQ